MRHEKWKVLQVSCSLIAKEGEEEAGGFGCFSGVSGAQRLWLRAVLLGEDLAFT